LKPFTVRRLPLRGLGHHVLTWGDPEAPKLFLLHGWMDVGASFQFLVDALARDWYAIAPDLRGFGRSDWQPQGYWYPDYIADLEALLAALAPDEPARLVGHSLGGNVVMHYAGIRPQRVRAVVSLDGFGIPAEAPAKAPQKYRRWLDALGAPIEFASYADLDAVADRLQRNNGRLTRERARFLAAHWAEMRPDGRAHLISDPRHRLPFPTVYRMEEVYAVWREITAPVLWVAALDSDTSRRLDPPAPGDAQAGMLTHVERRLAHVPGGRLATIADAGHMLHHDQPAAVAAAIEPFLIGAGGCA
jgi:pimeloyl-ACP methyl ester carboxylesterase